jgi:uncharacterized protein YciI
MSTFVVCREAGPRWALGGIYEQPAVNEHAAFMKALADEGIVLLGGPLAGTERGRVRVLLIVDADSEASVHRRLAEDPWAASQQLVTRSVDPWTILVSAEALSSLARAPAR